MVEDSSRRVTEQCQARCYGPDAFPREYAGTSHPPLSSRGYGNQPTQSDEASHEPLSALALVQCCCNAVGPELRFRPSKCFMRKAQYAAMPRRPRQGVKVIASQTWPCFMAAAGKNMGLVPRCCAATTGNGGRVQASNRTTLGKGCCLS